MKKVLRKMNNAELVNLKRLAYILKGLSPSELETLEILVDEDASDTISESLKELNQGKRIPVHEW